VSWTNAEFADTATKVLVVSYAMSDGIRITMVDVTKTLKSKWWVLLVSVGVCTGLLFAQASRFESEPARVETTRRLEGMESLSSLVALDIDAQAFAPILSMGGEIARFNSVEANDQRNAASGWNVKLSVSQTPGDYNVVNREVTERNTIYSLVSVGTGIFVFTCTEASERDCSRALDKGVDEFELARSSSIQASIASVAKTLETRLSAVREMIADATDQTALLAQRQLEAQLATQVAVLRSSGNNSGFALTPIDERVEARSATINSVTTSTYLLGAILGLLLGGLIILQFAALRSRRP